MFKEMKIYTTSNLTSTGLQAWQQRMSSKSPKIESSTPVACLVDSETLPRLSSHIYNAKKSAAVPQTRTIMAWHSSNKLCFRRLPPSQSMEVIE